MISLNKVIYTGNTVSNTGNTASNTGNTVTNTENTVSNTGNTVSNTGNTVTNTGNTVTNLVGGRRKRQLNTPSIDDLGDVPSKVDTKNEFVKTFTGVSIMCTFETNPLNTTISNHKASRGRKRSHWT